MRNSSIKLPNLRGFTLQVGKRILVAAAAVLLAACSAWAGAAPTSPRLHQHKNKAHAAHRQSAPPTAAAKEPLAATPLPPPPPPPLPPGKMPPEPPHVTWEGKQLTISADNSTLSDILVSVRALTGAQIDIPPSASRERIAVRLGPGPAREVLSQLLSWTSFDFIVRASDSDPQGIQDVLLMPRGKTDTVVASGNTPNPTESPRSSDRPGRGAQEAAASAPGDTAGEQPVTSPENLQTSPVAGGGSAAPGDVRPAPPVDPAAATAQSVPDDSQVVEEPRSAAAAPDPGNNQAPANPIDERIQQMQDLFEQRKQIIMETRKPQ